jgi:hypothetical protein
MFLGHTSQRKGNNKIVLMEDYRNEESGSKYD